jgi:hypothetical protein
MGAPLASAGEFASRGLADESGGTDLARLLMRDVCESRGIL